jgi:hypothetical protein
MNKQKQNSLELRPIGVIRSKIKERSRAPKQGPEGDPDVWLEVHPFAAPALDGLAAGDEPIVLTWLIGSLSCCSLSVTGCLAATLGTGMKLLDEATETWVQCARLG